MDEMNREEAIWALNQFLEMYQQCSDRIASGLAGTVHLDPPDMDLERSGLAIGQNTVMSMGKMVCITEAVHLCLAPQDVRRGDVVSILVGGKTLHILRPGPNG